MTIELYINGRFFDRWLHDDIREDYTELGIYRWEQRKDKIINKIKSEVYEQIEFNEYQFCFVYQSYLNSLNYTDDDVAGFIKELNVKTVDRIAKKYKRA